MTGQMLHLKSKRRNHRWSHVRRLRAALRPVGVLRCKRLYMQLQGGNLGLLLLPIGHGLLKLPSQQLHLCSVPLLHERETLLEFQNRTPTTTCHGVGIASSSKNLEIAGQRSVVGPARHSQFHARSLSSFMQRVHGILGLLHSDAPHIFHAGSQSGRGAPRLRTNTLVVTRNHDCVRLQL